MITYSRDLEPGYTDDQRAETEEHVRAHLSSIAAEDDDPETNADDVQVEEVRTDNGGLRITGTLDAEPDAPYLREDYDPDAEDRPDFVTWTPGDQPGWDPYDMDPLEDEEKA
jgi:hypothetical protein